MISLKKIKMYADVVAREFKPEKIILFGSYAWGNSSEDSDVDLLVVIPKVDNTVSKAVEIRLKTGTRFPMDIIVSTPEKISKRISMGDSFMKNIITKGKLLYESPVK
ncbi:MAG: nucleotidyltransferase domain-containing protein [Victivallales bacterium]|jgi:predicted nucleotidyltransferase